MRITNFDKWARSITDNIFMFFSEVDMLRSRNPLQ